MNNKSKKTVEILLLACISYMITISIAGLSAFRITQIDILLPCVFGFVFIIVRYGKRNWKKENIPYAGALAVVSSLTIVAGSKFDVYEGIFADWSIMDAFYLLFVLLFTLFAGMGIFAFLNKGNVTLFETEQDKKGRRFLLAVFLLLAWLPYYLTFFPGNMGPDTFESIRMCLGEIPWTNHHPVLFTFLIKLVLEMTSFMGSLTISMGIFSFLHMLIFALVLSYFLYWMYRRGVKKQWVILSFLFLAFHPIVAMYSIYLTKDVLFSCAVLLLVLKIYEIVETNGQLLQKRGECVYLAIICLLTIFLRNNGTYMVAALALCLLAGYRVSWKQLVTVFGSVFIVTALVKVSVFGGLGIEKQEFAESASIPLQQIGYVIANDGEISNEDRAFLEELMPISKVKEVYEPGYTDPYKFDEEFNDAFLNEHKGEFIKVWAHLCKDNFSDYVKAYLMQTAGYWHYGETNTVCTQGVAENSLGVEQIDSIQNITGITLEPVFAKLILAARKAPLFCMLSSMAVQMAAVLMCVLIYLKNKVCKRIVALVPFVVLWVTIMIATPAFCLFRYLFPVFLAWPLLVAEIFRKYNNIQE